MQNDLIELLKTFVAFESVDGRKKEKEDVLTWAEKTFLSDTKYKMHRDEVSDAPYLFLEHPEPDLLWFAHVDVVPGTPDQFKLRVEGEKAYGRGAKDMKGGALPFLLAYKEAASRGVKPRISILLSSDEEIAGPSIPTLLSKGMLKAPVAFTPDTSCTPGIITEHKGVVWAELIINGSSGHAAMPWESDNPIWKLSSALKVLNEKFPPGKGNDWQVTVSPTTLKGSGARNQIPDEVSCGIDIRYPPSECKNAEEAISLVQHVLPEDCQLKEILSASPLQTDSKHPMVQFIKSLAEETEGRSVEIIREHGGTDARYFSEIGIPAFLYGPIGGNIHGKDEWVSIPSLIHQYELCKKIIRDLS